MKIHHRLPSATWLTAGIATTSVVGAGRPTWPTAPRGPPCSSDHPDHAGLPRPTTSASSRRASTAGERAERPPCVPPVGPVQAARRARGRRLRDRRGHDRRGAADGRSSAGAGSPASGSAADADPAGARRRPRRTTTATTMGTTTATTTADDCGPVVPAAHDDGRARPTTTTRMTTMTQPGTTRTTSTRTTTSDEDDDEDDESALGDRQGHLHPRSAPARAASAAASLAAPRSSRPPAAAAVRAAMSRPSPVLPGPGQRPGCGAANPGPSSATTSTASRPPAVGGTSQLERRAVPSGVWAKTLSIRTSTRSRGRRRPAPPSSGPGSAAAWSAPALVLGQRPPELHPVAHDRGQRRWTAARSVRTGRRASLHDRVDGALQDGDVLAEPSAELGVARRASASRRRAVTGVRSRCERSPTAARSLARSSRCARPGR